MKLVKEIEGFLTHQPELVLAESKEYYHLKGNYKYNLIRSNNSYIGNTLIKITVNKDFPNSIPTVYLYDAPHNMEHVYKDKSVCLASTGEIILHLSNNSSLIDFIRNFVDPFIYTMRWFEEYGTYVFGERSHGISGLLEFYLEKHGIDYNSYIKMCNLIDKGEYRGHSKCFCGSGKNLRNCHGHLIIKVMNNKLLRIELLKEFDYISKYLQDLKILKILQINNSINSRKGKYL